MNWPAASGPHPAPFADGSVDPTCALGRAILQQEADAIGRLLEVLDESFTLAVDQVERCRGNVVVTGMGKAGLIGQKIAATLASTGTRSQFLHPAEALHGDLGRLHNDDLVLALSYSGETEEVLRLLPTFQAWQIPLIAITGKRESQLAKAAQLTLWLGELREAGELRLAPSASTTAMLALGDALALTVSQRKGFAPADFARFHPGGALGRQLAKVEECMRSLEQCRVGSETRTVREMLIQLGRPGRRSGAILLTDQQGRLSGIFTDSDLARMFERQQDALLDQPIAQVMSCSPTTVTEGTMMTEAVAILVERKISELPVIAPSGCPLGLLDITDVVAYLPRDAAGDPSGGKSAAQPLRIYTPTNTPTTNHVDEA